MKKSSAIEKIKQSLNAIGAMRPGSLTRQYKDPVHKTGAYWQLSYTHKMKSRTRYVRPEDIPEIKRQIATFKRFKKLTTRWIDLAIAETEKKRP